MQGGFCSKYRDICTKTNAADRPSQVIARHAELICASLGEERRNLGQPQDASFFDVSTWRLPVADIGTRTGLKFDADMVAADTISLPTHILALPTLYGGNARLQT